MGISLPYAKAFKLFQIFDYLWWFLIVWCHIRTVILAPNFILAKFGHSWRFLPVESFLIFGVFLPSNDLGNTIRTMSWNQTWFLRSQWRSCWQALNKLLSKIFWSYGKSLCWSFIIFVLWMLGLLIELLWMIISFIEL